VHQQQIILQPSSRKLRGFLLLYFWLMKRDIENQDDLITDQYKDKEALKKLYDDVIDQVSAFGNDVEMSLKKAYVSLRRKKQFALIQPSTKTRMDVGLNIKNVEPSGKLEAGGSWNAMCTHRIKIETEKDITPEVIKWIKQAYEQAR
jgi:predicted transport protein